MSDHLLERGPIRCPFCGGSARVEQVNDRGYCRVYCFNSLTCGAYTAAMPTRRDAVDVWNRRADLPSASLVEPPIYWRCFHCDFIAHDKVAALGHFGPGINERPPVCQSIPSPSQDTQAEQGGK